MAPSELIHRRTYTRALLTLLRRNSTSSSNNNDPAEARTAGLRHGEFLAITIGVGVVVGVVVVGVLLVVVKRHRAKSARIQIISGDASFDDGVGDEKSPNRTPRVLSKHPGPMANMWSPGMHNGIDNRVSLPPMLPPFLPSVTLSHHSLMMDSLLLPSSGGGCSSGSHARLSGAAAPVKQHQPRGRRPVLVPSPTRRKNSIKAWIDEDALHGPSLRTGNPPKRSSVRDSGLMRVPTLPSLPTSPERRSGMYTHPNSPIAPQQRTYVAPKPVPYPYPPAAAAAATTPPPPPPPPPHKQPVHATSPHRRPSHHRQVSSTDSDLASILQLTAQRLQDGTRSERSQKRMSHATPGFAAPTGGSPSKFVAAAMTNGPASPADSDTIPTRARWSAWERSASTSPVKRRLVSSATVVRTRVAGAGQEGSDDDDRSEEEEEEESEDAHGQDDDDNVDGEVIGQQEADETDGHDAASAGLRSRSVSLTSQVSSALSTVYSVDHRHERAEAAEALSLLLLGHSSQQTLLAESAATSGADDPFERGPTPVSAPATPRQSERCPAEAAPRTLSQISGNAQPASCRSSSSASSQKNSGPSIKFILSTPAALPPAAAAVSRATSPTTRALADENGSPTRLTRQRPRPTSTAHEPSRASIRNASAASTLSSHYDDTPGLARHDSDATSRNDLYALSRDDIAQLQHCPSLQTLADHLAANRSSFAHNSTTTTSRNLAPHLPAASGLPAAVSELRRMNSQLSVASSAGSVAGRAASPTVPELRGGGFSPAQRGTRAAARRNYLAVGAWSMQGGQWMRVAEWATGGTKRESVHSLYDEDGFLIGSPERLTGPREVRA